MKNDALTVAVFGGTGKVGQHFVAKALDAGHRLRVLARDAKKLEHREHPCLELVIGDVTKAADVAATVADADVVVSCLGNVSPGAPLMARSFESILEAAAAQSKMPRCLMITSIGCGGTSWLVKVLLILIGGNASFRDYETADQRIREEIEVPCVLVRPAALTDKVGTGLYRASRKLSGTFARPIARADVAAFLVDALTNLEWDGSSTGVQLSGKREQNIRK